MKKNFSTKSLFIVAVFILLIVLSTGCVDEGIGNDKNSSSLPKEGSYSKIAPEEAKKRLDSEKEIVLLDVRTKEEYESGHIKNAVLMPVDTLEAEAAKSLKDKSATVFVYCRSGNRSAVAANTLVKMGYTNVYDLGGIKNWPYETVK